MRPSVTPDATSYKSIMMGLNVLLMLDSAVVGASTWSIRETVIRRRRNRRVSEVFFYLAFLKGNCTPNPSGYQFFKVDPLDSDSCYHLTSLELPENCHFLLIDSPGNPLSLIAMIFNYY